VRASLCEKNWDSFIEIYGVPHWLIFMPPNVPKEQEARFLAASRAIAGGGNGALPHGSSAMAADHPRDSNPFRPRLDWLQEQLVLAGTGGLLSMLAMPTGLGHGASGAHEDAFKKISRKEARKITEVFNTQFDAPLLAQKFPGQPPLAYFELSANEQTNIGDICAQTLQLSQAGYQVSAEQLTEKTGYTVKQK
jgi:phage gp29-like protein